jgi:methoxymalonate biosynthesis acyl carrier protein
MPKNRQLVDQLGELFATTLHIEAPGPDADLLEEGILDSFQFVELLVQMEKKFSLRIDIAEIDLEDLRTLERIAELVVRNGQVPDAARPGLTLNAS